MTTFTIDNRWAPGASGAHVPDDALAAYAARWIDKDRGLAEILGDRQGFAYNDGRDRDALIDKLIAVDQTIRTMHGRARDVTLTVAWDDLLRPWCAVRRAGGYVYVDAWLVS